MFPEDFPAMLAVQAFGKRQVGTCVDAIPRYLWAEQLAVKSCHFPPGCVEPVSPACQAAKLRLIQKEGRGGGLQGKPEMYHLFKLWVGRESEDKKKKGKNYLRKFSQLSVASYGGNIFSFHSVKVEGNVGIKLYGEEARLTHRPLAGPSHWQR